MANKVLDILNVRVAQPRGHLAAVCLHVHVFSSRIISFETVLYCVVLALTEHGAMAAVHVLENVNGIDRN